jgi:hypothetical protein
LLAVVVMFLGCAWWFGFAGIVDWHGCRLYNC